MPYASHVVSHRAWPSFVNNPSVLNDVKADGKGAIRNVRRVKHRVYHDWTSGEFRGQLTGSKASFLLCSVRSDGVVVL